MKGVVRVAKSEPKEATLPKLKSGAILGELSWVGIRAKPTSVITDDNVIAPNFALASNLLSIFS